MAFRFRSLLPLPIRLDYSFYRMASGYFNSRYDSNELFRPTSAEHLRIGVQGACIELGQRKYGVADGPAKLRETRFIDILRDVVGINIVDFGDVNLERDVTATGGKMFFTEKDKKPIYPRNGDLEQNLIITHRLWREPVVCKNLKEIAVATRAITESTETIIRDGRICVTLGGDHTIGIGTVLGSGKVYPDRCVIWLDAHTDINTPSTSNSGNMHGMSLSFCIKDMIPYMQQYPEFKDSKANLDARSLVYIAVRDVEPYERAFLDMYQIKAFSMKEIDQIGINGVIERTLDYLLPGGVPRPLHVSLDVDSIDPHDIPCTGTPVAGGLTLRDGMHLLEELEKFTKMIALDVVELNPSLGTEVEATRSAQATEELIFSCFKYYRGGMVAKGKLPLPKDFQ